MPEGPQIVLMKEQFEHLIGERIVSAAGNAEAIPFGQLQGQVLTDIKTFGKEILFCFPTGSVRIHLMLFGKYAVDSELNRVLRLGLEFETSVINFYACECRFITKPLEDVYDWTTDVLHASFNQRKAFEKLDKQSKQLICEALLNQNIFAGVGNKIKNDVLFRKRIHPESIAGEIPETELKGLIAESVQLSHEYLNWKREGEPDDEHWQIYKKKECPRDIIPIRKEKIGKSRRSCYYCDHCQQLYAPEEV